MKTECSICARTDEGAMCGEIFHGYKCTRPERHEGEHVACALWSHDLERWPKSGPAKAKTTNTKAGGVA